MFFLFIWGGKKKTIKTKLRKEKKYDRIEKTQEKFKRNITMLGTLKNKFQELLNMF